jgi:tetratricopeptide (TPR) repeat protein
MLEKLGRMDEAMPRYREAAKLFAKSGNTRLEWAALDALSVPLGKAVNKPSLHIRAADDDLAEAEAVFLRLLELESNAVPSGEVIARTASNVVVILNQRAIRLHQLGETWAAIDRLNRIIAVARAHGLSDAEQVAMELAEGWSAQAKQSTAQAGLACVHCGNTSDASLAERNHQLQVRNRGREYYFAQCAACREKLAGTGYFALKMIVGSYPEIQLRRALAPGSDELWIA